MQKILPTMERVEQILRKSMQRVLSVHSEDDASIWKEFRRQFNKDDYRSSMIGENMGEIKA